MSFARYPTYKDSGVDWLGKVPAHWAWLKFRFVFTESQEKIEKEVVGPMLSVSGYRGIEVKEYDDENRRRTDEDLVGYRIVRPDQLVVNTMWLNYAGLGVSEHEGHVSPAYRAYFIKPTLDGRYAHHLMRSGVYVAAYTQLLTGVRPNSLQMSRDDLMSFPVLVPPLDDQRAIAAFLDRETAKIDALVAEQERLIELLKEKRQAVISHAVTKGLNPGVPMKDSGIEWLGEVPAHWDVRRLANLCEILAGFPFSSSNFELEGTPVIRMSDFGGGVVDVEDAKRVPSHLVPTKSLAMCGDILLGLSGSISNFAVVRETDLPIAINQRIAIIRSAPGNRHLLICFLQTREFLEQIAADIPETTILNISMGQLGSCRVPVPPDGETAIVVKVVREETSKLDALTAEAQRAIDLLGERRAALISAAVTGQIDVRPESMRTAA